MDMTSKKKAWQKKSWERRILTELNGGFLFRDSWLICARAKTVDLRDMGLMIIFLSLGLRPGAFGRHVMRGMDGIIVSAGL